MTQTRSPTATAASPDTGASSGRLMVRATNFVRVGVVLPGGAGAVAEPPSEWAIRSTAMTPPIAASANAGHQRRDHVGGVALGRRALEQQGQRGAGIGRAPRVLEELGGNGLARDDGIAPVVELDPLRQQLGAHAVCLAGDRIDSEPHAHQLTAAGSRAPGVGSRPRMPGGGTHGRRRSWRSISAPKTSRQLDTSRAAPSG